GRGREAWGGCGGHGCEATSRAAAAQEPAHRSGIQLRYANTDRMLTPPRARDMEPGRLTLRPPDALSCPALRRDAPVVRCGPARKRFIAPRRKDANRTRSDSARPVGGRRAR